MRTFSATPSGHGAWASASCASIAAWTAAAAVGKTTKNASPTVRTSTPPFGVKAARRMRSCCSSTGVNALPKRWTSFVEPSMSLKKNVSVPVGSVRSPIVAEETTFRPTMAGRCGDGVVRGGAAGGAGKGGARGEAEGGAPGALEALRGAEPERRAEAAHGILAGVPAGDDRHHDLRGR